MFTTHCLGQIHKPVKYYQNPSKASKVIEQKGICTGVTLISFGFHFTYFDLGGRSLKDVHDTSSWSVTQTCEILLKSLFWFKSYKAEGNVFGRTNRRMDGRTKRWLYAPPNYFR